MIKGTLISKYFKEKDGIEILENDFGFIGYKITGEECYITHMFTDQSVRGTGKGRAILAELEKIARSFGCKYIATNVWFSDVGATNTLTASLKAGFKIRAGDVRSILITKEIQEA